MLGTESEKGDVAFSLRWGMPLHWSCSDMQPERPRERWVWGSQWANCTPNALPSGKWQPRWLSTCWASLPGSSKVELRPSPLGALLRFQHFLCPLWKHTFSHCPQSTVRAFLPCFVQTWGGSSSKPYAGHLHEPTWFSSQPRLWDESHYPYHNKEPQAQKVPPTCIINSTQSHGIGKLAVKWSSHLVTLS